MTTKTKTDPESYETWYAAVNTWVERWTGVSVDDLVDYDYQSDYEDNCTAHHTARAAIRNNNE